MYVHNLLHRVRTLARPGLAAGIVVTLALLSAACSNDSASRISAPSLLSSSSNSQSAAAGDFAVLAGTAVDCTRSTVTGDVGIYPGTAFTPVSCTINGAVHAGDGVAKQATDNFLNTYATVASTPCDHTLTGTLNTTLTTPGVYCFDAGVTTTDGTLTLSGPSNGIWIFKIGTGGTGALTGTDFSVLIPGGDPCNVTWWVAQGATITDDDAGVPHPFVGTILAGAAITTSGTNAAAADRLSFTGNAFAKAGVTMTDTNLFGCAGGKAKGKDKDKDNEKEKCNQGVGNGPEDCDPGNSNHRHGSNDEDGGSRGDPGRKGGH
jgi:hypothetical protein